MSSCWCENSFFFLIWRFHYFRELVCKEERGSLQKGTCSLFTVAVINLDDLKRKTAWSNSDDSRPHGGSTTPHMRPDPDLFGCVTAPDGLSSTALTGKKWCIYKYIQKVRGKQYLLSGVCFHITRRLSAGALLCASVRMLCLNFLSIDRHRACLGWTLFMARLGLLPVTS